jgi:hypothetical protein
MQRKQSIILPEGNVLVKDFVLWSSTEYVGGLREFNIYATSPNGSGADH